MSPGSPGARRSFLDIAIAQLSPLYIANLRKFTHALDQRNALIKTAAAGKHVSSAEWEAYASVMAECAAYIAAARYSYTNYLAKYVGRIFSDMTSETEIPEMFYKTHMIPSEKSVKTETPVSNGEDGFLIPAENTSEIGDDLKNLPLPCNVRPDHGTEEHIMRLLCENTGARNQSRMYFVRHT